MKKYFIIITCIIISLCAAITPNNQIFLTDSKLIIQILLTLLGLCITSFGFISNSINSILRKYKHRYKYKESLMDKLNRLLNSIQDDIFLILKLSLLLVIINLIKYIDIPLMINPQDIDFGIIKIPDIKSFITNFSISLIFCLSIYSFYDLISATFKLIRSQY